MSYEHMQLLVTFHVSRLLGGMGLHCYQELGWALYFPILKPINHDNLACIKGNIRWNNYSVIDTNST